MSTLIWAASAPSSSASSAFVPWRSRSGTHTLETLDGHPVRVAGVSAFQALDAFVHDLPRLERFLTTWKQLSGGTLNWLRVFRNKPAAVNNAGRLFPGWDAPDAGVLPEFDAFCREHGQSCEITLITQLEAELSWVRRWVDVLGPLQSLWVEGVNEPSAHDKTTPAQLEPYGVLSLPRYSSGDYDPATPWKGTYFTLHPDRRGDVYDMASQAKTAAEVYGGGWDTPVGHFNGCHCACVHDEPGKFEDFGNVEAAIRQFYQGASLMSAGATVHTLESQFLNDPTPLDQRFAPVAFRGLQTFPASVPNLQDYPTHDTDDEHRTGAMNTYKMGSYGCRFGGALTAPEVIGV